MNDDMYYWLLDCYNEGLFSKEKAENILNPDSCGTFASERLAKKLFNEFIESYEYDSYNITHEACSMFLKEINHREKIEKDKKTLKENKLYHKLIE